ncbi:putative esterase [Phaeobacter piscinae]|uniref:Esterase n=1 Tax=Phaeobacter piscinae TaxID=1580596 RepID=A0ABM6PC57_9RHOB|nr:alpha/beta fold hydrolase [Phaeobacter piscinae]ATG35253.1 putative esterase [Phaeobacter piscinae]AUQ85773.1 putative esterase [Phaeobacter piscinae]AUR23657.1 putative esterase [Phaeobacter piscinae]
MLNTIRHGAPTDKPTLMIAHGLYGSARNWGAIAKRLCDEREVIAIDMRNHGSSPWTETHSYHNMADDLAEVIAAHGGPVDMIGHSMGGKAAMTLALNHPQALRRLLVADIAPVAYQHSQIQYIHAMRQVDLAKVERRSDAEAQLANLGVEKALQSFFTQSLDLPNRRWRLNLDTLERDMPHIMGFPETEAQWDGSTLFLSGAASDYVLPEHRPLIKARFSRSHFAKLPDCGHWLHAENPRAFVATARGFFDA